MDRIVSGQNWCSRLLSSFIAAICLAPMVLIGGSVLLGWNERRAVCQAKAIIQGSDVVQPLDCRTTVADGTLVMFSCDIDQVGLQTLSFPGDFNIGVAGTGLKADSWILQCDRSSTSSKNSVGGGTTTTYTYSLQWVQSPITGWDSNMCANQPQGRNGVWPAGAPRASSIYQPSLKVGQYNIDETLINNVPLSKPLLASSTPAGWSLMSGNTYLKGNGNTVGDVKVNFYTNDWNNKMVTVLGQPRSGVIRSWTAGDSWLCSGFSLLDLRMGAFDRQALFTQLQEESNVLTWVLRIVGFVMCWWAFCLCFGPFEVFADIIPCIGPMIGDCIAGITCCLSCLPGAACTMGVIGVVWVAMRPAVGIPLLVAFGVVACCMVGVIVVRLRRKAAGVGKPMEV